MPRSSLYTLISQEAIAWGLRLKYFLIPCLLLKYSLFYIFVARPFVTPGSISAADHNFDLYVYFFLSQASFTLAWDPVAERRQTQYHDLVSSESGDIKTEVRSNKQVLSLECWCI